MFPGLTVPRLRAASGMDLASLKYVKTHTGAKPTSSGTYYNFIGMNDAGTRSFWFMYIAARRPARRPKGPAPTTASRRRFRLTA
jgi:hypothetical protein